ncbi:MAG: NAD(+)/NADH kinase [Rikenellaceae bacterium]
MKIILFSRPRVSHSADDLRLILSLIEKRGYDYCVNDELVGIFKELLRVNIDPSRTYGQDVGDQPSGSMMICYGGDGTLLEGVQRLHRRPIVVAGINSGRLGFLTSVSRNGIGELFEAIESGTLRTERRQLLKVDGSFTEGKSLYAANEFSVQRQGASMISVETYVEGELVSTYYGDGVIVSTPTGSTAYSLSAGGPVVAPGCACWVISPLAPHNLTMRPLVVPDKNRIDMTIRMREGDAFVSVDSHTYPIGQGATVTLSQSESGFYLALPHKISFYETLRDKMMWGVDIRE